MGDQLISAGQDRDERQDPTRFPNTYVLTADAADGLPPTTTFVDVPKRRRRDVIPLKAKTSAKPHENRHEPVVSPGSQGGIGNFIENVAANIVANLVVVALGYILGAISGLFPRDAIPAALAVLWSIVMILWILALLQEKRNPRLAAWMSVLGPVAIGATLFLASLAANIQVVRVGALFGGIA